MDIKQKDALQRWIEYNRLFLNNESLQDSGGAY